MGRNILYIAFGFNGRSLVPISEPFVLEKNGTLRYISCETNNVRDIIVRRKYYQSENVVNMRRRLIGGKIQCADLADFSDAHTLYNIVTTDIPDKIEVKSEYPHRYWRYLSPDGSYGSIAELAFFDSDTTLIFGLPISNVSDVTVMNRAFDGDWLSNYETDSANENWIGMDYNKPVTVNYVRVVPRSDDNDICPGNIYELFYWTGNSWNSVGTQTATDNSLHFESIPKGALLWLRNKTRGWDERPFLVSNDGVVEWW